MIGFKNEYAEKKLFDRVV